MNVWLVGLGGVVGSLLRYSMSELSTNLPGDSKVLSVYICNVIGSFLLAWLLVRTAKLGRWGEHIRLAVGTGLLGSFTTFSALSVEAFEMLEYGAWTNALLYVSISLVGGWVAAWLGWRLGQCTRMVANKGEAEL